MDEILGSQGGEFEADSLFVVPCSLVEVYESFRGPHD
jgi:hypothetical protein